MKSGDIFSQEEMFMLRRTFEYFVAYSLHRLGLLLLFFSFDKGKEMTSKSHRHYIIKTSEYFYDPPSFGLFLLPLFRIFSP